MYVYLDLKTHQSVVLKGSDGLPGQMGMPGPQVSIYICVSLPRGLL